MKRLPSCLLIAFTPIMVPVCHADERGNAGASVFEYKQKLDRIIRYQSPDRRVRYKVIDVNGNFIDPDPARIKGLPTPTGFGNAGNPFNDVLILEKHPIVNLPLQSNEQVYEYRSGALVKGKLTDDGNFVPTIGSKVMSFIEYHYETDPLRIYNLPGTFVKKTKAPE